MPQNKLTTWLSEQIASPTARRLFEQERLVTVVTSALTETMERGNISRAELASRLGRSKAYVSQILSGSRNMTLHTLADVCWAFGHRADVTFCPLQGHGFKNLELPEPSMRAKQEVVEQPNPTSSDLDELADVDQGAANSQLALAA